MKSNQHTFRLILLFTIVGITLATFPRINRTKIQHTYVDYLNQNLCQKTTTFDQTYIDTFRKDRKENNLIEVSLEKIIEGDFLGSVFFKGNFFLNVVIYALCFIGLFASLRRLGKYNNSVIKSGIKMSEGLNGKGNNKKNLIFKGLALSLLLFNVYNSIIGNTQHIKD